MLQAINRYEPVLGHFNETGVVHPEALYRFCVAAAGELCTFTTTSKRAPRFPTYRHDHLKETFDPVIASLRESMSKVMTQNAIPIPLEPRKFGISVAIVPDRSLFSSAVFILAARADGPAENLRQRFPAQVKIAPAEKIGDLVRQGLSGVPLVADAGRAAADSLSRGLRLLRTRSEPRAVGAAEVLPAGWRFTSPASSQVWRWNSGRFGAEGRVMADTDDPFLPSDPTHRPRPGAGRRGMPDVPGPKTGPVRPSTSSRSPTRRVPRLGSG